MKKQKRLTCLKCEHPTFQASLKTGEGAKITLSCNRCGSAISFVTGGKQ